MIWHKQNTFFCVWATCVLGTRLKRGVAMWDTRGVATSNESVPRFQTEKEPHPFQ